MQRKIITTSDGSKTIYLPEINEYYHSKHGALNEAMHVFIESGLNNCLRTYVSKKISILEIGFGTGLNALLTLLESEKSNTIVDYTGIEAYPVKKEELQILDYSKLLNETKRESWFDSLHDCEWERRHQLTNNFSFTKRQQLIQDLDDEEAFDLIYFDAFGPRVQPELWTDDIFRKMYKALKHKGVLVTYSAKGSVRRDLLSAGFAVERLPGPPGKREMLRASV